MKDIIIGICLLWCTCSNVSILIQIRRLWEEIGYLEDIVEDWEKYD